LHMTIDLQVIKADAYLCSVLTSEVSSQPLGGMMTREGKLK